jgi:hypothetical protein
MSGPQAALGLDGPFSRHFSPVHGELGCRFVDYSGRVKGEELLQPLA